MKKLRLAREVVRILNPADLRRVNGGGPEPTPPYYYSQVNALCLVSRVESCRNCLTPD